MSGKEQKPETVTQAQTWQRVRKLAETAGLCPRCASQLAWGSQGGGGGFSTIKPPCAGCTVVMRARPVVRPNGWRTPRGTLSVPASWSAFTPMRRTAPPEANSGEA